MFATLFAAFLPSIIQLVQAFPGIIAAWDASPTNSLQAVNNVIKALPPTLVTGLAAAGGQVFPKVAPELQAAAAALMVAHPNNTSYLQSCLNLIASTGIITFGPVLVVDGIFGAKTFAAVEALQAYAKLPVNGLAADAEYSMISGLLAKIDAPAAPAPVAPKAA